MSASKTPTLVGLSTAELTALDELQTELNAALPSVFEALSASLFSRLVDAPVHVSKSGYQYGADAGTNGLRGRRLRIECKRYQETTSLDTRSLIGEIEQAAQDDPYLEAWTLMATRTVSEGDRKLLMRTGEARGVPVVIVSWDVSSGRLPNLASLCAMWPEVVEARYGSKAAKAARALSGAAKESVDALRSDLEPWAIGFKALRVRTMRNLEDIWGKKGQALSRLNQNAAGAASGVLIARAGPEKALDAWWNSSEKDTPVAVHGPEGHGKTWAALSWLTRRQNDLPIVLPIPASALSKREFGEEELLDLIAVNLRTASDSKLDVAYWRRRAERMLDRPASEPASLLLVLDGANQNPSFPWAHLARASQGARFLRGVRLLLTVRTKFLLERKDFQPLVRPFSKVPVGQYTREAGGELEQALRAHGIDAHALHPSLRDKAAVPRILPLIARLKDSLALRSETTVHRILWEYGRDEHCQRTDASLTAEEFEVWISEQATAWKSAKADGGMLGAMTSKELAGSVHTPAASPDDVANKLSDLVESLWIETKGSGARQYSPSTEALVLGLAIALLDLLRSNAKSGLESLLNALTHWLEPITAFDETTEVVRAALAISCAASPDAEQRAVTSALMSAWLYAQNPTDAFEDDVLALGSQLPASLLDAMEQSSANIHARILSVAAQALRRVPVSNVDGWREIDAHLERWAAHVQRPPETDVVAESSKDYAQSSLARLERFTGATDPGVRQVLGVQLTVSEGSRADLVQVVPSVMEGHQLERFKRVFVGAAVACVVRSYDHALAWVGLRALSLFVPSDDKPLRAALRAWSQDVLSMSAGAEGTQELKNRVAALLLDAAGEIGDEIEADRLRSIFSEAATFDYQTYYEKDPVGGLYPLERRHVDQVLRRSDVNIILRLRRAIRFLADTSLVADTTLQEDLAAEAESFSFEGMESGPYWTGQDTNFEELEPGLARFSPPSLAWLARRRLSSMMSRTSAKKYWSAIHARRFILLATPEIADAIGNYRRSTRIDAPKDEDIANMFLLLVELLHLPAEEQLGRVAEAKPFLANDLMDVLQPGATDWPLATLSDAGSSVEAVTLALNYFICKTTERDDRVIDEIVRHLGQGPEQNLLAMIALYKTAPQRLFESLLSSGWRANPGKVVEAHYGSLAFGSHGKHLPFADIADVVAPWMILDVVAARGGDRTEFELAVQLIDKLLRRSPAEIDVLADIEMVCEDEGPSRVRYTEREDDKADLKEALSESFTEANQRRRDFAEKTSQRIEALRAERVPLLYQAFSVTSLAAAWEVCAGQMTSWISRVQTDAIELRAKLHSASGLYFALCEVLLSKSPALGAALWRELDRSPLLKFDGAAGVSNLTHMLFRVSDSPEVSALRAELLELPRCSSDLALLNVVVAAQVNRAEVWLENAVTADESSVFQWRRKRGVLFRAMTTVPDIAGLKWPQGEAAHSWEALQNRGMFWANRATLARHWWNQFLLASATEDAYAAFVVFLSCADRRAFAWMSSDLAKLPKESELSRLKALQWTLNDDAVKREMEKQEKVRDQKRLGESLLGFEHLSQWLTLDGQTF